MSNSPIQISTDLSQVLARIEQKIDSLQTDVTDLKIGMTKLEGELKGEIKALEAKVEGIGKTLEAKVEGIGKTLEAKVEGISKRLDTQEFINRSVVVGFVLAVLASLFKLFFPNLPNG